MKTSSKLPPKYIALDDTWYCEEDGLEYTLDIANKVWKCTTSVRERKFPDKYQILKSLDNDG